MFEEGFSSITTWTAGVPDPAWLNIYIQAEWMGNRAHGVPPPRPALGVRLQPPSRHRLRCSVGPCCCSPAEA